MSYILVKFDPYGTYHVIVRNNTKQVIEFEYYLFCDDTIQSKMVKLEPGKKWVRRYRKSGERDGCIKESNRNKSKHLGCYQSSTDFFLSVSKEKVAEWNVEERKGKIEWNVMCLRDYKAKERIFYSNVFEYIKTKH